MSYRKVFWGVILVLIGMLFLLRNLGYIEFSWYGFWHLWPLLLLLWGISILPIHSVIRLSLSVLVVIATLWIAGERGDLNRQGLRWSKQSSWDDNHFRHHYDMDDDLDTSTWDTDTSNTYTEQSITEPWDDGILSAVLRLDAAAGDFTMSGTTDELMIFEKAGRMARYNVLSKRIGESQVIDLSLQNTRIQGNVNNKVKLALNPSPVWDFDLDIGAAELNFDLTPFKIGEMKVDGGACAITLKFGDLLEDVDIDIDAGAASIVLEIPKEAGCNIEAETFITSKDLEGFDKLERGKYRTPGYEDARVQFHIKLNAGIASFEVKRY